MKLRRGVAAARIVRPKAASGRGRGSGVEGEVGAAGDDGGFALDRVRRSCRRRCNGGEVNRRRGQLMQNLADLAAIFVVERLRRRSRVLDDRRAEMPGEDRVVVVPAEQDRLKQHRKQAEPRR